MAASTGGTPPSSHPQQQLTFTDYDDLQSRLVLLPRDEEEGIGAVISMYYSRNHSNSNNDDDAASPELRLDESMAGYVLHHIGSSIDNADSENNHKSSQIQNDFGTILSTIRNHPTNTPIVLTVSNQPLDLEDVEEETVDTEIPNDGMAMEEEKKTEDGNTMSTTTATTPPPPPPTTASVSPNIRWSTWTSRMSVTATALVQQAKQNYEPVVASVLATATTAVSTTNDSAKTNLCTTTTTTTDTANTNTSHPPHNNDTENDTTEAIIETNHHIPPHVDATTVTVATTNTDTAANIAPEMSMHHERIPVSSDQATTMVPCVNTSSSSTPTTIAEMAPLTAATTKPQNIELEDRSRSSSRIPLPDFHIYVQSETGAFVPVPEPTTTNMSSSTTTTTTTVTTKTCMTNSSYIMVRINAQQAAPVHPNDTNANRYRYQWYRSGHHHPHVTDNNSDKIPWVKLPGATGPTIQPSATEIGYRLRCVVYSEHDINEATTTDANTLTCETADIVTAALPILNGSRQALARGAQFGGLLGQGKAEGRIFRIKIVLSSSSSSSSSSLSHNHMAADRRKSISDGGSSSHHSTSSCPSTVAAVTIYQVVGMTAEPIHPEHEPLFCRTATVWDYNQIKDIALVFQSHDLPPSASMVAALCSTDNDIDDDDDSSPGPNPSRLYFRVQAPNRLARESMLLSLGIANFQGKPSDLNANSILFHHHSQQLCHEKCNGSASSSLGDDSIVSQSSSPPWPASPTPEKITVQRRTTSFGGSNATVDGIPSDRDEELEALRSKLSRKDKVVSELQRQVTHSDDVQRQTATKLSSVQKELEESQAEVAGLRKSLTIANDKLDKANNEIQSMKSSYDDRCSALERDIQTHKDRITALERENRTLQNDKDVLNAAIESRDFKLFKMEELQTSLDEARVKLAQRNNFQLELDEANKRYNDILKEVERLQVSNSAYIDDRRNSQERIASLEEALRAATSQFSSHQSQLEMEQMKVQKLKAERNSYKQKGDSLAKEMSRICRDGRTIREIEKLLADDATRREEVNVLREQKRKALEQVEHFRTAYEQSLSIQKLAGMDHDAGKLLERNAELERLLSELTEYLNAKEMQLDTMKQVNDTLQSEIRNLARASMSNNDI